MHVIISAQALVPWSGGSAISEASLCSHMANLARVTVLTRKGEVDYAFARSFGLKDICEYEKQEVFEAWKNQSHWLNRLVQSADFIHLNGHWRWEDHFLARLSLRHEVPYLMQPRGMLTIGRRRAYLKRLFNVCLGNFILRKSAKVIALSHYEAKQICHAYRIDSSKTEVIPNGIPHVKDPLDVGIVFPSIKKSIPNYFLYLGRLEARKNLVFLINAFNEYVRNGGKSSLLLVGPVERGYDNVLHGQIEKRGIGDQVRILRPVYDDEKWHFMRHAKAVIYPTILEPFGRVPFEAISAGGIPIIPSESGSAEYLRTFLPQCIYTSNDMPSLLKVMEHVEQWGTGLPGLEGARHWVKDELDWKKIVSRVASLYEKILADKPEKTPSKPQAIRPPQIKKSK